jgi:hypothetical protein
MELSFSEHSYNKLLNKAGLNLDGARGSMKSVIVALVVCWLPLAIITLFMHKFWTGNVADSFISSFDTQARFLITMPILIFSESNVSLKLGKILKQFLSSGIVQPEDNNKYEKIIGNQVKFLKSGWIDLAIFTLCYLQVFIILFYTAENTHLIGWELGENGKSLNLAGWWSTLVSRPFVLYMFYKWFLRIVAWGFVLYKISRLKLNLYPPHPDRIAGLGFLSYSIRYFSPVAFAVSATVAGNMADFVLIEGSHVADLKFIALAYFIFVTLLFVFPMLFFVDILTIAREQSIFENNDYANGIFRELQSKVASKGYHQIDAGDLNSTEFSTVCDMGGVFSNVMNMQTLPFTIKDLFPLWVMIAIPFVFVMFLEFPVVEVVNALISVII